MAISHPTTDRVLLRPVGTLAAIDWIAMTLLIVGGLNWLLVGAFNFDLVAALFGPMSSLSRVVYGLVGLAALYGIFLVMRLGKRT